MSKIPVPRDDKAERAVLGACILSKDALFSAISSLKPTDFYDDRNKNVFETIAEMYYEGKIIDLITLTHELTIRGVYDRLGGDDYMAKLLSSTTLTRNISGHIEIIRQNSIRRGLLTTAEAMLKNALDLEKSIPDGISEAEKLLFEAGQNKDSSKSILLRDLVTPTIADIETRQASSSETASLTGYPTSFPDLDSFTGGLQPGSLTIIAARPSMGKTAFAMNIAQFGGRASTEPVLIFSLEMPSTQLVQRMIAAESGVDLSRLSRGIFSAQEFMRMKEAADVLSKQQIYINDATQLSAVEFRARCRRFKARHPDLALVVVDYLQLMSASDKRTEGRQQEVSDISRMLKAAARDINCPVVALSQLSREAEKRTDKKPQLADLRDSGAIEQDADLVLMLFREDYYSDHEASDLTDSKADIRIAKNRNGSTGVFHLTFRREITRFFNYGEAPQ